MTDGESHSGSAARSGTRRLLGTALLLLACVLLISIGFGSAARDGWLIEHIPEPLRASGPRGAARWQWGALLILVLVAYGCGTLLSRAVRRGLLLVAGNTSTRWDDLFASRLSGPVTAAITAGLVYAGTPWLGLPESAEPLVDRAVRGALFVAFFWALARGVDVLGQLVIDSPWGRTRAGTRSLVPVGARAGKVVVLALAVVALLAELGYPVASLVAGLGIGGLALALAAQKTVENLFGAFSIAADQPFREGDFVKIEDFVGTVEAIGLRSTKIRTLDRTLISLPNGRLAEMRLESFTARDRIRLHCFLGLAYGTKAAQLRAILAGLEQTLRAHPRIWPDAVVVRFCGFGAQSLDIEVMAWFQTSDYGVFQGFRQEVFLSFMDVVERNGSAFALPTRVVRLAEGPGQPPGLVAGQPGQRAAE